MNFNNKCPNCGDEDIDIVYRECCAKHMCENCAEVHDEKYHNSDESKEQKDS
jgi:transcription initiation factor TFIIIB Brf1 subunit/transcription initiation factor TFIIB